MQYTIDQTSKVASQGEQKFIVIQKKFHRELEKRHLLGRDLKVTVTFDTDVDVS